MSTTGASYSAMDSLETYLSAQRNPEALRVSRSGDIQIASGIAILFDRAGRLLESVLTKPQRPIDWDNKAREALLQKFSTEIHAVSGKQLAEKDKQDLNALLSKMKVGADNQETISVRDKFSRELRSLKTLNQELAASLEKIFFLENPKNAKILGYVKPYVTSEQSLRTSMEMGLTDYLHQELEIEKKHASGLSKNIYHLMINYKATVDEALEIIKTAGDIKKWRYKDITENDLIPLSYLMTRHNLSLRDSVYLKKSVESKRINGKTLSVMDARAQIDVIQTYGVTFGSADAIVKKATALRQHDSLKDLSNAQLTEISKLVLENNKSLKDAVEISLRAGIMIDSRPVNREPILSDLLTSFNKYKEKQLLDLLPFGWYETWEARPDGSRQLKETEKFTNEIMRYLNDSFSQQAINEKNGLSENFLLDAPRQKIKFDNGETSLVAIQDADKAISILEQFAPDPEVRKNLSKTLYQAGGNSIDSAMYFTLKRGINNFSIKNADGYESIAKGGSESWIELQYTDEGKIHVTYTHYMKHIALEDDRRADGFFSINPRLARDAPASPQNYSGKASVTIELDPEELKKGIVNPEMVGEPFLTLTIELN